MALELKNPNYKSIAYTHNATITKGTPIYIATTQYVFPVTDVTANVPATFVHEADVVEVDCDDTLTYVSGQAVYDADAAPTGSVNKTSGAGRKKIGVVSHPEGKTYAVGTAKIHIRFIPNEV
jgi:hypothetical protein